MNDEIEDIDGITREEVADAIADPENEEALDLLTLYWSQLNGAHPTIEVKIKSALICAKMLFEGKRYEDVIVWLDGIATQISDTEGPDSEAYQTFAENEDLEELKMKATDKIYGGDTEEEDNDVDFDENE